MSSDSEGRVVSAQQRNEISVLISSHNWRVVTASELWDEGLDYGEDEREGRKLEMREDVDGTTLYVRASWNTPDGCEHVVLSVFPSHRTNSDGENRRFELTMYGT